MTKENYNLDQLQPSYLIDLIKYPVITEKSTKEKKYPSYTFLVTREATKLQIKAAIESAFNVTIEKVNTLNLPRKTRRFGKNYGNKSRYKKVIVRLKENNKIDFYNLLNQEQEEK